MWTYTITLTQVSETDRQLQLEPNGSQQALQTLRHDGGCVTKTKDQQMKCWKTMAEAPGVTQNKEIVKTVMSEEC